MPYGWYNQGMNGGWWVVMMVGMLVFWAILVIGVVALLRHYMSRRDGQGSEPPSTSAIEILRERFARGELNEEEYSRRLALLKEKP
jgi:putative membrane protein